MSVDGVRALGPIVVTLNAVTLAALMYAIQSFPAPEIWSPLDLFGVVWCIVVGVLLMVVTLALVWSLAEPRQQAVCREENHRTLMMRASLADELANRNVLKKVFEYVTSWQGQTVISSINHMAAICLFVYGLLKYKDEITPALRPWLIAGVIMSVTGLLISGASVLQRKYPRFKLTPTDDSFRLAAMLKIFLVMTKSMVVFLLASIDDKTESFEHWELVVSCVSFVSLGILALLTLAFALTKVWQQPSLLIEAGVNAPKHFIAQYAISYLCAKAATVFFMLAGELPALFDCKGGDDSPLVFDMSLNSTEADKEGSECILCFPVSDREPDQDQSMCDDSRDDLYYACTSSCAKLFFSGGGNTDYQLRTYVLAPLAWLPFAVYSNNEVAQLIDGLWWRSSQARQQETVGTHGSSGSSSDGVSERVQIGLSTSSHGYYTVTPLVHAVTVGCAILTLVFYRTGEGGYFVNVPSGLLAEPNGPAIQEALHKTGTTIVLGPVILNVVMVLRVILEIGSLAGSICGQQTQATADSAADYSDDEQDESDESTTTSAEVDEDEGWLPADWDLTARGTQVVRRPTHEELFESASVKLNPAVGQQLSRPASPLREPEPEPEPDSHPAVDLFDDYDSGGEDDPNWRQNALSGRE